MYVWKRALDTPRNDKVSCTKLFLELKMNLYILQYHVSNRLDILQNVELWTLGFSFMDYDKDVNMFCVSLCGLSFRHLYKKKEISQIIRMMNLLQVFLKHSDQIGFHLPKEFYMKNWVLWMAQKMWCRKSQSHLLKWSEAERQKYYLLIHMWHMSCTRWHSTATSFTCNAAGLSSGCTIGFQTHRHQGSIPVW